MLLTIDAASVNKQVGNIQCIGWPTFSIDAPVSLMYLGPADVAVLHRYKVNGVVTRMQNVAVLNVHALHLVHLQIMHTDISKQHSRKSLEQTGVETSMLPSAMSQVPLECSSSAHMLRKHAISA
jgi:hypothetical protein